MQSQAQRDTGPELSLRRELHRRGLRYRLHVRVLPGLRRSVDIVFPRQRLAVDVRGCFWHGCEEHSKPVKHNGTWWSEKLRANVARDSDTGARLREAGWNVIVVWEHDDVLAAADRIELAIRGAEPDSAR